MTFEQLKELICENFGVSEDKVTETADLQKLMEFQFLRKNSQSARLLQMC